MNESPNSQQPDWAVQYARGALRIGMNVPEIEQHLVSRGLSPELANRIVMDLVEQAVQAQTESLGLSDRNKPLQLLIPTVIGGVCVLAAYWFGGGLSAGRALIVVAPALLGIWVPVLTDTDDSDWGARSMVFGWIVLLLYLGYRIFLFVMLS